MRILVVDDSASMRKLVRRTLREAEIDAKVTEAADAMEAYALIGQAAPDLVICDFKMPGVTGLQLLTRLRAEGVGVAFGFVTSHATPALRARAMVAGASFVITKPFSADAFKRGIGTNGAPTLENAVRVGLSAGRGLVGVPLAQSVSAMLTTLVARPVDAIPWRTGPGRADMSVIGALELQSEIVAVTRWDLQLAAALGGAFTMLHPDLLADIVASGRLPPTLLEAVSEVLNVLARGFVTGTGRQPAVAGVEVATRPSDPRVRKLVREAGGVGHMAISVPGYGRGRVSFWTRDK